MNGEAEQEVHEHFRPLVWAKSGTFITSYLLFCLFANMYGFWGAFGLNIFGFGNILELITNASLFVAHAVVGFMRVALGFAFGLWTTIIVVNWLGGLLRKPPLRDFSLHVWLTKLDDPKNVSELVVLLLLVGFFISVVADPPNSTIFLVYFVFAAVGIAAGSAFAFTRPAGWSRTLITSFVLSLSLLPAMCYARGLHVANGIKLGCGVVRWLPEEGAATAGLPVYLGHAGEFFFLYDDVKNEEVLLTKKPDKVRLGHVDRDGRAVPTDRTDIFGRSRLTQPMVLEACVTQLRRKGEMPDKKSGEAETGRQHKPK